MKLGLGESYDKVSYLPVKIRAYLDLTKPASSIGVTIGFFVASIFYFESTGSTAWLDGKLFSMIYASATVFLAHAASQVMNMAEDAEMDKNTEHKKNRPIPSGVVSVDEARSIAWILVFMALVRGFLVNSTFGIFITIAIFMGVFYNLEPIRAKQRALSVPWQATSRGLLFFPTVWAAYGNPLEPLPWVLSTIMFFYVLGYQNSADIIDKEVDELYGVKTFVVMFGVEDVVHLSLASIGAMMVVLGSSILLDIISPIFILYLGIVPFCLYMSGIMYLQPEKIDSRTGNHPAWLLFYLGMVLMIVFPLTAEVLS